MALRIFGGLALVLWGASAVAAPASPKEEWVRVAAYVDGSPVEVDRQSIRVRQGLRDAWWRVAYSTPRKDGSSVERRHELIDCAGGLTSTLEIVSIDTRGAVINDAREPESAALRRLSPATPGTTGEAVAKAICAMRLPAPSPPRRHAKRR